MTDDERPVRGPMPWSRHDTDAFTAIAVERRHKKGAVVIRQGEPTRVHLILHGWLKVTRTTLSGHEVLLVIVGPGELTGHFEAIQGPLSPADATVIALEPTVTLSVAADRFVEFLLAHPHACFAEARALVEMLVNSDHRRIDLALVGAGQRLAALLVDLAVRHGRETPDGIEIAIALSQDEIAGMIGASRDSVIRALTAMRVRGVVTTGRRSMTVRDLDALRSYAASEREAT